MRGINRVVVSGNCMGKITFAATGSGNAACSFTLASDRHASGEVVTARVKINAYGDGLVGLCRTRLVKGLYVLVEGELMNRDGIHGELTEVRARDIIFLKNGENQLAAPEGGE